MRHGWAHCEINDSVFPAGDLGIFGCGGLHVEPALLKVSQEQPIKCQRVWLFLRWCLVQNSRPVVSKGG
jgi:hypothetical protein